MKPTKDNVKPGTKLRYIGDDGNLKRVGHLAFDAQSVEWVPSRFTSVQIGYGEL